MAKSSHPGLAGWLRWLDSADGGSLHHLMASDDWKREALGLVGGEAADVAGSAAAAVSDLESSRRRGPAASHSLIRTELRRAADERRQGSRLSRALTAHPEVTREALLDEAEDFQTPDFQTPDFVLRLLRACRDRWFMDARGAEDLARLAIRVCEHLDSSVYTHRRVEELRSRSWSYVGNALRLQGKTCAAEGCMARAAEHLRGCVDLRIEAEHAVILARLRGDQERFAEAGKLVRRSVGLYRELDDEHSLVQALTSLGSHYLDQGSPDLARPPLAEALERVDEHADPRTALNIHHNLCLALAETERFAEAQQYMERCRPLYDRFPDPSAQLRRQWLRGIVAAGLGETEEGEETLRRVLAAYVEDENHLLAALTGLDLASVYARAGRRRELQELAEELTVLCIHDELPHAALTAMRFFLEAVKADRAIASISRQVARFLKRSARNPSARFRPGAG